MQLNVWNDLAKARGVGRKKTTRTTGTSAFFDFYSKKEMVSDICWPQVRRLSRPSCFLLFPRSRAKTQKSKKHNSYQKECKKPNSYHKKSQKKQLTQKNRFLGWFSHGWDGFLRPPWAQGSLSTDSSPDFEGSRAASQCIAGHRWHRTHRN